MPIARKLEAYMARRNAQYDVIEHSLSQSAMESANLARVQGDRMAKSVVLEDDIGFVVAVLPATCRVKIGRLDRELNRKLHLVTEDELPGLFADCTRGAIPPVGLAYGITTVVDESLDEQPEVYFEAGDHRQVIHMKREDFALLMDHAQHARFAARV